MGMMSGWRAGAQQLMFKCSLLVLALPAQAQLPIQAASPPEQRSFFGAAARAELDLTADLALEATLNGTVMAKHAKFLLLRSSPVYQVPIASFGGTLGILLRLR